MIKPILQDEAFLIDVQTAEQEKPHLWWLGQSGFLVKCQGSYLLIDPYLSDTLTQKYAGTEKPHVRMTERVIAPERLDFIDLVTSSHNHTDHLDPGTLIPLLEANPRLTIIVSQANLQIAAGRLNVEPGRLTPIHADGPPVKRGSFTFNAIPSAHEILDMDEHGEHKYLGFLIHADGKTIYHSGDACLYDGLVARLRKWPVDLALLPINGRDPARGVAGNFTAGEAAQLAADIGARLVVPCHFEMFEFNTVSPEVFIHEAEVRQVPYKILRCGEQLDL